LVEIVGIPNFRVVGSTNNQAPKYQAFDKDFD